jgi:hypothetical protein
MKIKFLSAETESKNCKASITAYGVLKFNADCNSYMSLSESKRFLIGVDEESDSFDKKLYIAESTASETDKSAIQVKKAGDGYSLPIASICDNLKIDYKKNLLTFSLLKGDTKYNKMVYYVLSLSSTKERSKYKERAPQS